jgi:hypothetical protein
MTLAERIVIDGSSREGCDRELSGLAIRQMKTAAIISVRLLSVKLVSISADSLKQVCVE